MEVKNSLVKKEQKQTFSAFLATDAMKKKINEMVGGEKGQQFVTSIISAVSTNSQLAECDNASIVSAALLGQALNLSPSPQLGQYYMVPYNKTIKKADGSSYQIKVAQFQMGYKGYIQLMKRSGQYRKINVLAIKEGELIKYDPLNEEIKVKLIEDDEIRENTPTLGYYAMIEEVDGFTKAMYWSKKKMLIHADKFSQAFNKDIYQKIQEGKIPQKDMWKYSSFWYKDFDRMAYKTMLRQIISQWGTLSIENNYTNLIQQAYTKDMAEIKENGDYEYIDNTEIEIEPVQTENPVVRENLTTEIESKEEEKTKDDLDFFFNN